MPLSPGALTDPHVFGLGAAWRGAGEPWELLDAKLTGDGAALSVAVTHFSEGGPVVWPAGCQDVSDCGAPKCAADGALLEPACLDGACGAVVQWCAEATVCALGICAKACLEDADCSDGDGCTADLCAGGACSNPGEADGFPCDDGSACTAGDQCASGTCTGEPVSCDDGDVCTADSCDVQTGCGHQPLAEVAVLPEDTSLEGADVLVTGCTLVLSGPHTFTSLTLVDGATLTHPSAAGLSPEGAAQVPFDLAVTGDLVVDAASTIDVSGRGWGSHQGPAPGNGNLCGSGAGHGASGSLASTSSAGEAGGPYDQVTPPAALGSGGGGAAFGGPPGGAGGGLVRLQVGGALDLGGAIRADGMDAGAGAGGGAVAPTYLAPSLWPEDLNPGLRLLDQATVHVVGPITFATLALQDASRLSHDQGQDVFDVTILGDASVDLTSAIDASGKGHPGATGPGVGMAYYCGNGGGYGGPGTTGLTGPGGIEYGSVLEPVDFGSGGGGRMSLILDEDTFGGKLAAEGGVGAGGVKAGAGTVLVRTPQDPLGTVWIGGGGGNPVPTYLDATEWSQDEAFNLVVTGTALVHPIGPLTFASLSLIDQGFMSHDAGQNVFEIAVTGDMFIDPSSRIDVSGKGHGPASGPGKGGSLYCGAGGSHVGGGGPSGYCTSEDGTCAHGGPLYDVDQSEPLDFGSGGGECMNTGPGGAGGGRVRIQVGGELLINGKILAQGASASFCGGGGSGGSIHLIAGQFGGFGEVRVDGGDTGKDNWGCTGGGGGGGKILLASPSPCSFPALQISYDGGFGYSTGGFPGGLHVNCP